MSRLARGSSVGCLLLVAFTRVAYADQTLIADQTFEHLASEGSHHHAKAEATLPADLSAPVDYRKGSVHLRVDLTKMASAKGLHWLLTLEQAGGAYVCVGPQKNMPASGLYEWDVPISAFECLDPAYDYAKPPKNVSFIIRDTKGVKIDPGNSFDGAPDLGLYFPLTSHVTVTLVSNGATYTAPADAGAPIDSGVSVDHDASTIDPADASGTSTADSGSDLPLPASNDAGIAPTTLGEADDGGCATAPGRRAHSFVLAATIAIAALLLRARRR